jgi:hypothetical protein
LQSEVNLGTIPTVTFLFKKICECSHALKYTQKSCYSWRQVQPAKFVSGKLLKNEIPTEMSHKQSHSNNYKATTKHDKEKISELDEMYGLCL